VGKDRKRSRTSHTDSDFKDFKNFHIPKVFKGFCLVLGLILGIVLTAFIKNTITDYYNNSIADQDVDAETIQTEAPPRPRPRPERPKATAPRLAPPAEIAVAAVEAPRAPIRKIPSKSIERVQGQASAVVVPSPAPLPLPAPNEPKPLPKLVSIAGLSYDRDTFVNCSEDCTMNLRSRSGNSMKVKLRKSQFINSMDRENSRIDIEGYVTDDRMVRVESIRAYPKREPVVPVSPTEMFPDENEDVVKVKKPAREEFDTMKDTNVAEAEPKHKSGRVQPQSLKSRLEASTGNSPKPAPSDENGGSFQDRLKRSTR